MTIACRDVERMRGSLKAYSVWSFEHAIQNGGDDAFPDRIAPFARAVLLGDETQIRASAAEIGVRMHPMLACSPRDSGAGLATFAVFTRRSAHGDDPSDVYAGPLRLPLLRHESH
jgi:hypothetical protein